MSSIAFLLIFLLQGQPVASKQVELSADGNLKADKSRAYCGIYAAYGAASAVLKESGGKPSVEFPELLSDNYVSSYSGSSTEDLLRAVEKLGCDGKAYQCLSFRSLEGSSWPLILHVSGRGALGSYNHWVLFLGVDSGSVVLQDGEGGSFPMPASELLSRWDGKAIAVFPKGTASPKFYSWEILANCILLAGVGFMVTIARSFASRHSFKSQSLAFLALLGVATFYCIIINSQIRIDANIARAVEIHTDRTMIKSISYDDLQRSVFSNTATIVDCRYRTDYESGFINSAISVPVDVSQKQLLAITRNLSKDVPIFLYCQSGGCHFSDIMAVEFAKLGFTNLSIYRNGYVEWEAKSK
jgi:rhodanese-related sulfurtransferase